MSAGGLGKVLLIGRTNLLRQVRDRGNLFFILALPTIIIVALGLQFGGSTYARLGVVAPDGDPGADALIVRIREDSPVFTIIRFPDEAALRTAVERGTVEAGVVLPGDYGAQLAGSGVVDIGFLGTTETVTSGYRAAVEAAVAEQQALVSAARAAAKLGAGTYDQAYAVAQTRRPDVAGVAVTVEQVGADSMFQGYSQFTFGAQTQLLLFTFLTSMTAAGQLVLTRRLGVSRRMLSTPTSMTTIILGETLGRFLVALFQAMFVVLITATVFNVSWGDPIAASAIILLFCLVSAGAAMLVGAVSQNADQASSLGVFAGLALGALGGCMVPLAFMPQAMQTVAKAIPHSWAITALSSLVRDGGGIASVATNLLVLAGFAVVLLGLATWRFRKAITG
jgi:ABC-2 type transport system permease protein